MPWVEMYVFKSSFYSAALEMLYFSHCRRDVQNPPATHLEHLKRTPASGTRVSLWLSQPAGTGPPTPNLTTTGPLPRDTFLFHILLLTGG